MSRLLAKLQRALLLVPLACDPGPGPSLDEHRSGTEPADARTSEVIFSPQPPESTHNLRVAELIAAAEQSLDIAMYSFSDAGVEAALRDAAARGVKIRLIFESAKQDRKLDADERAQSRSGRLETAGIDVRYINKIMHHKFMIVDGPRDALDKATTALIATGSANWSAAAATRYDENTLFLRGHEELALRLQAEFNLLWEHSRDFVLDEPLPFERSEIAISEDDIVDLDDVHVLFTSDNFDLGEPTTFTSTRRSIVQDALIDAIAGASESIRIASGHLRSREIAEALINKASLDPDIDIRVYLDAQEYINATAHARQMKQLQRCLAAARDDCLERGYRFGYMVDLAGVDVRYKWYSYRWSYVLAAQMHHKYVIIDGDELWTGSYNFSSNAEHETMENMFVFSGDEHAALIDEFEANFEALWATGRSEQLYERLLETIATAEEIPLLFEPMALEWDEIGQLRALIRKQCPRVDSPAFRSEPGSHAYCTREDADQMGSGQP